MARITLGIKMPTQANLTRDFIHHARKENPEKFREIVETECPEFYGLPSYHQTGKCVGENKCKECWQEALKYEFKRD